MASSTSGDQIARIWADRPMCGRAQQSINQCMNRLSIQSALPASLAGLTVLLSIVRTRSAHRHCLAAEKSVTVAATNTVQALAHAVDAKDSYTRWHSDNVRRYARAIAEQLDLPRERVDRIGIAGQLHDVGKIAVPDAVLLKD